MGISWKEIKEELGIVKTAPYILCFVSGALLTWFVDARTISNFRDELGLCHTQVEAREHDSKMAMNMFYYRLETAVQIGDSPHGDIKEALNICRKLWPEMRNLREEDIIAADEEMAAIGCGYGGTPKCQMPAVLKMHERCRDIDTGIRGYQKLRPMSVHGSD